MIEWYDEINENFEIDGYKLIDSTTKTRFIIPNSSEINWNFLMVSLISFHFTWFIDKNERDSPCVILIDRKQNILRTHI